MRETLGGAIIQFHRMYWARLTTQMGTAFEKDLTKSQFLVLGLVAAHPQVTMSALSEHTGMLKQQITRIVDRLEEKGFVTRERSQTDRRSVCVKATARADAYLRQVEKQSVKIIMATLSVLNDEELARMADSFSTINALLDKVPLPADPLK